MTYQYDSWGNIINTTDTSRVNLAQINPFRYRSYYYDSETNLYYLNSRYYNPEIGRFISVDSQLNSGVLGNNMYIYCGDNPVIMIDEDGTSFHPIKWLEHEVSNMFSHIEKTVYNIFHPKKKDDIEKNLISYQNGLPTDYHDFDDGKYDYYDNVLYAYAFLDDLAYNNAKQAGPITAKAIDDLKTFKNFTDKMDNLMSKITGDPNIDISFDDQLLDILSLLPDYVNNCLYQNPAIVDTLDMTAPIGYDMPNGYFANFYRVRYTFWRIELGEK